jgi:hypothetical protein
MRFSRPSSRARLLTAAATICGAALLGTAVQHGGATAAFVDLFQSRGATASRPAERLNTPFPTANNTGVPDGVNLTPWPGQLLTSAVNAPTQTVDGRSCKVFDGYLVSLSGGSYLSVNSPCVMFRNSRFTTSGVVSNTSAILQQQGSNTYLVIESCEFDGGPSHQRGLQGDHSDMVIRNSKFIDFGQAGVEMNNRDGSASLTVLNSYFAESSGWPQSYHVDGIQVGGGNNVTIRDNTVLVPPYGGASGNTGYVSNSALGLWAELGDVDGVVTVDHNLLAGGGQVMYLEQKSPYAWRGPVAVTNNVFDQRYSKNGGIWGPLYTKGLPSNLTWFGNTWSSGAPLTLDDALNNYS